MVDERSQLHRSPITFNVYRSQPFRQLVGIGNGSRKCNYLNILRKRSEPRQDDLHGGAPPCILNKVNLIPHHNIDLIEPFHPVAKKGIRLLRCCYYYLTMGEIIRGRVVISQRHPHLYSKLLELSQFLDLFPRESPQGNYIEGLSALEHPAQRSDVGYQ